MSCVEMRGMFWGGWLFSVGGYLDAGGRRRRNKGWEGRWPGHILINTNGITDKIIPSVTPLAILSVYGHPGLNPTVFSSVKPSTKTFTSSHYFVF